MSVEEAFQEFETIMEEVYKRNEINPLERTNALRRCLEDLMKRKGLPLSMKLVDDTRAQGCARYVDCIRN